MSENKQALQVAALKNGTVIDHIPSEKLFTVVQLLGVEQMKCNITIGFNLDSKKLGKKGIIKIADKFFCDEEINRISVVAPYVKLNIIRDYEVVEKKEVRMPDELHGIVKWRPFLNDQTIRRNMFRIHSDHGIQCVPPGCHCLPWDCRDQIYINILKSCLPCQIITLFKLPHRMYTPEQLQFLIIDRLQSKTDPVNPTCPVCLQIFFCDRTRIRFHRNFRICLDLKHIPERIKNFFHLTSR